MFNEFLNKVINGENLSREEMKETFSDLMTGDLSPVQISAILAALATKGESIHEIVGAAEVMRAKSNQIKPNVPQLIDTCGTGGDRSGTFNISTTVGFVVAGGGLSVAKHGNRSITSQSGSSDVLEALGIKIDLEPLKVAQSIEKIGIGFMFAPLFHPAVKHAMPVRQELKVKTIFNMLGPLTNPANAAYQLIGVFAPELTETFAHVLRDLGTKKALIVHGDGLDEITLTGKTRVSELKNNLVKTYEIEPTDYGFKKCSIDDLSGGDAAQNARILTEILDGKEKGPKRNIVILNAGAAFYAADLVDSIQAGVVLAEQVIDSGKAKQKLNQMIELSKKL